MDSGRFLVDWLTEHRSRRGCTGPDEPWILHTRYYEVMEEVLRYWCEGQREEAGDDIAKYMNGFTGTRN